MFLTLYPIIKCLCNLGYPAKSLFTLIDILKSRQGYLFRVKIPGPGLQYLLSLQPGLTREYYEDFPHRSWKPFAVRAFILRKMFLTLNFIISCLCNLDYPANSLFALIDIFKVSSRVFVQGKTSRPRTSVFIVFSTWFNPGNSHCLSWDNFSLIVKKPI